MKKLILLLCVLFGMNGFAQVGEVIEIEKGITIGELNNGYPKLEVIKQSGDNLYILTYRNSKYREIVDLQTINFYGNDDDLEKVYQLFRNATEESKSLTIGDDRVHIGMSNKYIMISVFPSDDVNGHFYLSQKELKKLFGKA